LWMVYPDGVCCFTPWLMGLWSTEAKVEGIVPRAALHWNRNSSVINYPHGELGCTPLYVGLPSVWCFTDSDLMFFPICRRAQGSFWGIPAMNE
jgi:hypothetical protein